MTGTAYLTALQPTTDIGPYTVAQGAAVYVLDPEWIHIGGITSHVIVSASLGDTCIWPCDESGQLSDWDPIESFPALLAHRVVLLAVGYRIGVAAERVPDLDGRRIWGGGER